MLSAPKPSSSVPCEELQALTLRLSGEPENRPPGCEDVTTSTVSRPASPHLNFRIYRQNLLNPKFVPTTLRMALVASSIIFTLNYGETLREQEMTRDR